MSPEMAALREKLKMEEMRVKHERKMIGSWGTRHTGALMALFVSCGFVVLIVMSWLDTYGPEGVREWLELFGCRC